MSDSKGGPRFSYGQLPPDVATRLRAAAGRIRAHKARELEAIVEIGRELIAVRDGLAHGLWLPWVEAELSFSERSALNYAAVAGMLDRAALKSATVADLTRVGLLYRLAASSTGTPVREQLLARLRDGKPVTDKDFEAAVEDAKVPLPKPAPTRPDLSPPPPSPLVPAKPAPGWVPTGSSRVLPPLTPSIPPHVMTWLGDGNLAQRLLALVSHLSDREEMISALSVDERADLVRKFTALLEPRTEATG